MILNTSDVCSSKELLYGVFVLREMVASAAPVRKLGAREPGNLRPPKFLPTYP
jgi:hypothetical protein